MTIRWQCCVIWPQLQRKSAKISDSRAHLHMLLSNIHILQISNIKKSTIYSRLWSTVWWVSKWHIVLIFILLHRLSGSRFLPVCLWVCDPGAELTLVPIVWRGGCTGTGTVRFFCLSVSSSWEVVFKKQNYIYIMWPWTTKPVLSRWGLFVAVAKIHCMGQTYRFLFYVKNIN